ncbi:MAG: hypothetical protein O2897_04635 [bacterium]|nr:hypothetical protein [bacterium]
MFEKHHEPLASLRMYYKRLIIGTLLAVLIIILSLAIGTWGYMFFEGIDFTDAFLNASLILTSMGPAQPFITTAGKYFASFYAIYSSTIYSGIIAIIFAPILHREFHKFILPKKQ